MSWLTVSFADLKVQSPVRQLYASFASRPPPVAVVAMDSGSGMVVEEWMKSKMWGLRTVCGKKKIRQQS